MTQHALITGASSGIGAEFARQLYARGYALTLVARRKGLLEELKSDLLRQASGDVNVCAVDLLDRTARRQFLQDVSARKIDLLINNAGRGSFGYFEELSIDQELAMLELNVAATLDVAHAIIPQMKSRRAGAIISLSSVAGFQPLPYMSTYAATKAFNFHHSIALREELRPFGVKVLIVCPGPTATEFGGVARVPGEFTGVGRDAVEMVVARSLSALESDSGFVIPGVRSWLMSVAGRLLPKVMSTRVAGWTLEPSLKQSQGHLREAK
ncbi:MAG: SDR family oxidoreductase [Oligoflexia bacterium]|nr:SDR family oxidoreductase [Oligoflexia bacterium]